MEPEQRFTALWQAHHAAVLRYAARRTDTAAAQDVVSETFPVAWRRLGEVPDDPVQARPWLYGVARRALANSQRTRRRAERLSAQLSRTGADESLGADPADEVTGQARVRQPLGSRADHDQERRRLR